MKYFGPVFMLCVIAGTYGLGKYDAYNYKHGVEQAKKSEASHIVADAGLQSWNNASIPVSCSSFYEGVSTPYDCNNPPVFVASCFHVHLSKVDDSHYLMDSRNECGRELRDVYALVKFLDDKGRRIGVSNWQAHYVAKGEHLYKTIPTPDDVKGFSKVQVRLITDDPLEGAK